jgi:hypothetical protein
MNPLGYSAPAQDHAASGMADSFDENIRWEHYLGFHSTTPVTPQHCLLFEYILSQRRSYNGLIHPALRFRSPQLSFPLESSDKGPPPTPSPEYSSVSFSGFRRPIGPIMADSLEKKALDYPEDEG